jgi:Pyruvate/2-oxoacid:ferredoxin oxidoreductase delta subunit/flavodoxin
MATAVVACFSITGTTRSVAESVARGLRRAGFSAELADITARPHEALSAIASGIDLLAVGSPTHYFRLPASVTAWLAGLPELDSVRTLPFVLHGTYVGAAGNQLRGLLAAKGAAESGYRTCPGTDSYLPYLRRGVWFAAGHPDAADLAAAEDWARRAARDPEPPAPRDGRTHWVYALERAMTRPPLVAHFYSRFFLADTMRCDGCGICAHRCPVGNVTLTDARTPRWGRSCLACFECQLRCPRDAISSPADWRAFTPFVNYNVRQASRDPAVSQVRADLEHGRIVPRDPG